MIPTLKRYVIEREIPGVGKLSREQLKQTAMTSLEAAAKLYGKIQWEHSYITADKTFCVHLADSEASILEHAQLAGFPANKITEALTVINPMTAFQD
jgi:hypothetical protein